MALFHNDLRTGKVLDLGEEVVYIAVAVGLDTDRGVVGAGLVKGVGDSGLRSGRGSARHRPSG